MSDNQHTPVPWDTEPTAGHDRHGQSAIYGEDGKDIAIVYDGQANAEFIVRACNSHDDLLAALKGAENCLRWASQESTGRVKAEIVNGWIHHADQAHAAVAKANGETQ